MGNALEVLKKTVRGLENNRCYKTNGLCEPQLGKRGMYPTVGQKGTYDGVRVIQNFLAYADGKRDLIAMSDLLDTPLEVLAEIAERLKLKQLIKIV